MRRSSVGLKIVLLWCYRWVAALLFALTCYQNILLPSKRYNYSVLLSYHLTYHLTRSPSVQWFRIIFTVNSSPLTKEIECVHRPELILFIGFLKSSSKYLFNISLHAYRHTSKSIREVTTKINNTHQALGVAEIIQYFILNFITTFLK